MTSFRAPTLRGLDFHGSPLATFEHAGERWVVMKPVVEGMGLAWTSQGAKLRTQPERFSCNDIVATGSDGKRYSMTCIPLRRYPSWLHAINPAKIPHPAVRQRVELFQEASTEALYQFWATGSATVHSVGAVMREADPPAPVEATVVPMPLVLPCIRATLLG